MLLHNQRQDTKAGPLFEQALAMRRRCYGDDTAYFDLLAASPDPNHVASDEVFIPHPELCLSYCHLGMHAVFNRGISQGVASVFNLYPKVNNVLCECDFFVCEEYTPHRVKR
jgi:hypothetical protein